MADKHRRNDKKKNCLYIKRYKAGKLTVHLNTHWQNLDNS